jgi:hypothetical protein
MEIKCYQKHTEHECFFTLYSMGSVWRNLRQFGALVYEYLDFGNKELAMITQKRKQAEEDYAKAKKV